MDRRTLLATGGAIAMVAALEASGMLTPSGALDHTAIIGRIRALYRQRETGTPGVDEQLINIAKFMVDYYRKLLPSRHAWTTAFACQNASRAATRAGDVAEGVRWGELGAQIAEAAGDNDLRALALVEAADANLQWGRLNGVFGAVANASAGAGPWTGVRVASRAAVAFARNGDAYRTAAMLDRMDHRMEEATGQAPRPQWANGLGDGWATNRRALAYKELGQHRRALDTFQDARALQSSQRQRAQLDTGIAECLAGLGAPDAAATIALDALPTLTAAEDYREVARLRRLHAGMVREHRDVGEVAQLGKALES